MFLKNKESKCLEQEVFLHYCSCFISGRPFSFPWECAWFALYLKAGLNVGMAKQGESSLALDSLYVKISYLEKNLKGQPF